MKLIKQSFEICNQTDFSIKGIKQFIEKCARVSYKSEDKITDSSYEKFVDMLIKRDHTRPLEFGTVHLKLTLNALDLFQETVGVSKMFNNQWIQWNIEEDSEDNEYYAYMTTNYRYYLALLNEALWLSKYIDNNDNKLYPKRYTVHFIISRGIMDEFRTHISLSHLAESTRYCNYSKDKFDNQITFIIPNWIKLKYDYVSTNDVGNNEIYINGVEQNWYDEEDEITKKFLYSVQDTESAYIKLLKKGCTPQQAREVLPLAVKSELISCGFEDAWKNFFYRRCAKDAHPMAQEIAKPLNEEFTKNKYI